MPQTHTRPVILIVGTRPEGIKMVPLYLALKRAQVPVLLCTTLQHDELLTQVFDVFGVTPDITVRVMRHGQDLFYLTQIILQKMKHIFTEYQPSMVIVQGDTTSTMAAALAAFYLRIPVGHVEAGLRTDDIGQPFPEEMNRRFVGTIASQHYAPTSWAASRLLAEGIAPERVVCTGNTVVDALRIMRERIDGGQLSVREDVVKRIAALKNAGKKIMLLTTHRRESFNGGTERILQAVKNFVTKHPDVVCMYPYHPNPRVVSALTRVGLAHLANVIVCEPLAYTELVYVLTQVDFVATDSGGIQEEAISLGKHVLVLREKTERMEGVWAGLATLVGTDGQRIEDELERIMHLSDSSSSNVYGDGHAATMIAGLIKNCVKTQTPEKMYAAAPVSVHKTRTKETAMKKVCVLGLGYIGLPTSIVAAEHGLEVVGFDIDATRVAAINAGDPVIQEPEVFEKLQGVLGSKTFRASTSLEAADFFIIAVPTPFKEEKKADLSCVFQAAESIAHVLKKGDVVIIESTIPVGTTKHVAEFLAHKTGLSASTDFAVAHCPERVLPGKIFKELVENDRIIGGITKDSVARAKTFYKYFVTGGLYLTDATTAEMVKLVENSSRDVQIAFANQVGSMAHAAGLNPFEVIELANKHPRVNILNPGCGVGGHCIAVDPWFLIETFPQESQLLHAARTINDEKPKRVIASIKKAVASWQRYNTGTCTVALMGLTYKPDVDDLRESPALAIAQTLTDEVTCEQVVCEPHINSATLREKFGLKAVSATDALVRADVIVYLVGHTRFKVHDAAALKNKMVLDVCGLLHTRKPASTEQEHMFWPASSTFDSALINNDTIDARTPEVIAQEKQI